MSDVSVGSTVEARIGRTPRSVLRDVFGVYGVNSAGTRRRSLREQLERLRTKPFVRVACVTVNPPGGGSAQYVNQQRDLDNATVTFEQGCGVWVYCAGAASVTSTLLGSNGILDQDDCNAGWLLDFIGIGDHDVSDEEDDLFDLGRSLGARIIGYFVQGAVSGLAGALPTPTVAVDSGCRPSAQASGRSATSLDTSSAVSPMSTTTKTSCSRPRRTSRRTRLSSPRVNVSTHSSVLWSPTRTLNTHQPGQQPALNGISRPSPQEPRRRRRRPL